ncbi:hypothetical protein [Coxiella-like endosymbiont]|uniref:hypothetical protein n=1 Tax=Coxiella-like endosymbiont TaxID=1592897 RepID=UPI00286850BF|nr:hypothetical protein [Coxiella-like endosymbiont]
MNKRYALIIVYQTQKKPLLPLSNVIIKPCHFHNEEIVLITSTDKNMGFQPHKQPY